MNEYCPCPTHPEKCETAMSCRLQEPLKDCPYVKNKSMRDDCCVSMGHPPPTIKFGAKGHIQEMRDLLHRSSLGKAINDE